jgi:ketosteroid isomerase-like protein
MLAVVVAAAVPLAAGADEGQAPAGEAPMVAATHQASDRFRELWNASQMDQLVAEVYTDHSVLIAPNHEPIRGRAAIAEYLKGARAQLGEYSADDVSYHITSSDTLVSLLGDYSFRSGTLRFNAHELYERQPDGSVRNVVDMFGFR